jgi:hypothetical protein
MLELLVGYIRPIERLRMAWFSYLPGTADHARRHSFSEVYTVELDS